MRHTDWQKHWLKEGGLTTTKRTGYMLGENTSIALHPTGGLRYGRKGAMSYKLGCEPRKKQKTKQKQKQKTKQKLHRENET